MEWPKAFPATVLLTGITMLCTVGAEVDPVTAEAQPAGAAEESEQSLEQARLARGLIFTAKPDEAKAAALAGLEQYPNSASLDAVFEADWLSDLSRRGNVHVRP